MKWFYFGLSIVFEIMGTTLLKMSDGNEKWYLTILSLASYIVCFWSFGKALKDIEIGIAYSMAAGFGIVGATLVGFFYFKDSVTPLKILFICLILIGSIGLKMLTNDK